METTTNPVRGFHPASANLRRVAPYFRPHRAKMWFVGISAMVSIAAALSTPLIAKAVIAGPIARGADSLVWRNRPDLTRRRAER